VNFRELFKLTDSFRASVWLIVAYLIHLTEEWFGGFPEWSRVIRGDGVSAERFVLINSIALLLFVILAARTRQRPGMVWFPTTLAAVFLLNGILHTLATFRYDVYSPGTVTGLLISIPLGFLVLHAMRERLSTNAFVGCLGLAALVHVFITFAAFR
jgi:hypothetical protein